MPFRVSRQVAISSKRRPSESASQPASRSQTKSHGFTYYDLHPCPLPLLLFLLPSRLLPPHSPSPSPPPPLPSPPSCLVLARACLLSLLHPSPSSIPSFPSSFFGADLKKKCHFTDVSVLLSLPLPRRCYSRHATIFLRLHLNFLEHGTGNSC